MIKINDKEIFLSETKDKNREIFEVEKIKIDVTGGGPGGGFHSAGER